MRTYSTRKRILVTGGAGFLGSHHLFGWSRPAVSHLRARLLAEGSDVLCADNFFTRTKDRPLVAGRGKRFAAVKSTSLFKQWENTAMRLTTHQIQASRQTRRHFAMSLRYLPKQLST